MISPCCLLLYPPYPTCISSSIAVCHLFEVCMHFLSAPTLLYLSLRATYAMPLLFTSPSSSLLDISFIACHTVSISSPTLSCLVCIKGASYPSYWSQLPTNNILENYSSSTLFAAAAALYHRCAWWNLGAVFPSLSINDMPMLTREPL